jgi:hypothetical protein
MKAEGFAVFRAFPPFFFGSYEMSFAEFSDILEVIDHAHAVLGSITLDSKCDAGFRFEAVVTSATGTWILISCMCAAEAAIHPQEAISFERRSHLLRISVTPP